MKDGLRINKFSFMPKGSYELRVALVGSYPPPYGGITIHVQRLKAHLDKNGYKCIVYSSTGRDAPPVESVRRQNIKKTILDIFFSSDWIIHYHDTDWRIGVVIGILGLLGKKVVFSIHGENLNDSLQNGGLLRRAIIKFALRHTTFVIADNADIRRLVLSLGIKPNRVDVVSAFIAPMVNEVDYHKIPQYIWDFMKIHEPVISANAFRISFHNGFDLYGLDMIVDLLYNLIHKYPKIGVVFCLPQIGDEVYFSKIKQEVERKGLTDNILFITEPLAEAYPIWAESNIFVRPTVTDGDSLSIREALSLKTPVVTSDSCPRPNGVILFKNRDLDDFVNVVQRVWENYDTYKRKLEFIEVESGVNKIVQIYNRLAGSPEDTAVR